ncbi:hypothetical protein DL98DRAFT_595376 [Cadophora sp. DSE1049]|nr:hypothetical protein DL98DRAFT_595376 [Cadophora sp. DSE1049]
MCENSDAVAHIGEYLAKIPLYDDLNIPWIERWSEDAPSKSIFLKVTDSTKPTKVHVNALNSLNPRTGVASHKQDDDEYRNDELHSEDPDPPISTFFEVEQANIRSLLVGLNLNDLFHTDFLECLSEPQIDQPLSLCTDKQRSEVRSFARKVPLGLLLMTGAPGAGKTTALTTFILCHILVNKSVGVYASSNSAEQSEQIRMAASQFDPANTVIYANRLTYHESSKLSHPCFELARKVRQWSQSLNSNGMAASEVAHMNPGPDDRALPFMISPTNSFCYKALRGPSKGNTQNAHLMLAYIDSIMTAIPEIDLARDV